MTTSYTYLDPIYIDARDGGYIEASAEISYVVTWPYPASHGQPYEDASAEIQAVRLLRGNEALDLPQWLSDLITEGDRLTDELLTHAREVDEAARDDAADQKRQTMLEAAE